MIIYLVRMKRCHSIAASDVNATFSVDCTDSAFEFVFKEIAAQVVADIARRRIDAGNTAERADPDPAFIVGIHIFDDMAVHPVFLAPFLYQVSVLGVLVKSQSCSDPKTSVISLAYR